MKSVVWQTKLRGNLIEPYRMASQQTIRSSSKWLISSNLVAQVLQFSFGIALARLLIPADFGMIITIQIFTGFVGLVASGGLGQSLLRAKEANERDFQVVFSVQLAVGIIIYSTFFLIAPYFSIWFGEPLYKDLLRVSAINFLIRPFLNMHNIWLNREMRFKETSVIGVITNIASGLASILMALSGWGVWSLIAGGVLGSILNGLLLMRLTPMRPRLVVDRAVAAKHGMFGLKMTLNDLVCYLRQQTSNFIITKVEGPAMVGLFNKGDSLARLPLTTISGSIYQPVFRSMAVQQENTDRIKYLFLKMASLLMLYTLPFYVGLWWLAEPLIVTLYGPNWREAAIPLQIMAPLGILYCIGHPAGAVLSACNRVGREVIVQVISWIIVGLGCYFGLQWGLIGVCVGIVLSQLYSTAHMYFIANDIIKISIKELFHALGPALMLNGTLASSLIFLDAALPTGFRQEAAIQYLFVSFAVGGLTYGAAFLFLPMPSLRDEALRWRRMLRIER